MNRLQRWVRDIQQATYFDIQNVCDYYFSTKDEEAWTSRDFTIAPPFDFFATRFKLPDTLPVEYRGLDILTVFRLVDTIPQSPHKNLLVLGDDINTGPPVKTGQWQYRIELSSATERIAGKPAVYYLCADSYGQIVFIEDQPAFWVVEMPNQGLGIVPNTFLQISLLALTFLNCRNVKYLPAYPDPKRRRGQQNDFIARYHRLKVAAIDQRRNVIGGPVSGQKRSLHIVRGHFREYGLNGNGKLFGKYAGRYWVATHTAGDLKIGITTKDYEIVT